MEKRKREKQIKFYVDEKELERIEKKIERSKLKKSDYLRAAALEKEIIVIEDFKEFFIELKKQGTNLNQIAKALNKNNIKEEITVTEYINNRNRRIYIYEIDELVYGTSQKIETLKELDVSICYIYENIKDANLHFKQNGYNKIGYNKIEKTLNAESKKEFNFTEIEKEYKKLNELISVIIEKL